MFKPFCEMHWVPDITYPVAQEHTPDVPHAELLSTQVFAGLMQGSPSIAAIKKQNWIC